MTKLWVKFLGMTAAFLLVTLGFVAMLNYLVDPAHIFSSSTYEKELSEILRSGKNAAGVTNYDDRLLQRYLVEDRWETPSVIALGSSRSYKWRERHFTNQRFFNHSVNGSSVADYIAIVGLYDRENRLPKTIILGAYPWLMNPGLGGGTWESLSDVFADLAGKFSNWVYIKRHRQTFRRKKIITLFSLKYAEASVKTLMRQTNGDAGGVNFRAVVGDGAIDAIKRSDGSYRYHSDTWKEDAQIFEAAVRAGKTGKTFGMANFTKRDPILVSLFVNFLTYLREANVEVIIFLPPYHPGFYNSIKPHSDASRISTEEIFLRRIAKEAGIVVIGSYDPSNTPCKAADFLDERHPRESCHDKILGCLEKSCPSLNAIRARLKKR